ncbi:hypothetical protein ACJX0J_008404, partial [Zea mays]
SGSTNIGNSPVLQGDGFLLRPAVPNSGATALGLTIEQRLSSTSIFLSEAGRLQLGRFNVFLDALFSYGMTGGAKAQAQPQNILAYLYVDVELQMPT